MNYIIKLGLWLDNKERALRCSLITMQLLDPNGIAFTDVIMANGLKSIY